MLHDAPERPLTPPEATLWWFDRGAPIHFATVADVDGALTDDMLRAGLDALRRRHPLLRVRITGGPEAPRFAPLDAAVPLVVESLAERDWGPRLETELATPMPAADAPLLRCICLRDGPSRSRLLLTLHHTIGDGRSGVLLARDLLLGAIGTPLPPRPPAPPLWDARPARTRGLRGWAHLVAALARDAGRMLRWGRPRGVAVDARAPLAERHPGVHTLTFDAAFTAALTGRARAERTTVHALLTAVLMQTMATEHPGGPVTLSCGTPVDLRPHLDPPIGEDLGYYVGLSQSLHRVDAAADPWPLARAVRAPLVADVARGVPIAFHLLAARLFAWITRGHPPAADVARRTYELPIRSSTGITNLGRLGVPETYGDLHLTGLFFVVAPSALADFVSTATCHAGRLHWSFTAMAPAIGPDRAARLVAQADRRLRALID